MIYKFLPARLSSPLFFFPGDFFLPRLRAAGMPLSSFFLFSCEVVVGNKNRSLFFLTVPSIRHRTLFPFSSSEYDENLTACARFSGRNMLRSCFLPPFFEILSTGTKTIAPFSIPFSHPPWRMVVQTEIRTIFLFLPFESSSSPPLMALAIVSKDESTRAILFLSPDSFHYFHLFCARNINGYEGLKLTKGNSLPFFLFSRKFFFFPPPSAEEMGDYPILNL